MGGGTYSSVARTERAVKLAYASAPINDVFESNKLGTMNQGMNPHGVTLREARDSDEHPLSLPIIIGLDVTGSMWRIPEFLVRTDAGLPHIVDKIIQAGINDPQVLFAAFGDHEVDSCPLQIGQFESSDELMDKWLTMVYLEGGGGGNAGESYMLPWYLASQICQTDHWDKRGKKGYLITIGDEPCLTRLPSHAVKKIFGAPQPESFTSEQLLKAAQERWHVYHLNILEGCRGQDARTKNCWKGLLGENVYHMEKQEDVSKKIAQIVIEGEGRQYDGSSPAEGVEPAKSEDRDAPSIIL